MKRRTKGKPVAWRYRYVKKKGVTVSVSGLLTGNVLPKKRIVTTGPTIKFRPYSPLTSHSGYIEELVKEAGTHTVNNKTKITNIPAARLIG